MVGRTAADRSHFGDVEREALAAFTSLPTSAKKSWTAGGQGD